MCAEGEEEAAAAAAASALTKRDEVAGCSGAHLSESVID